MRGSWQAEAAKYAKAEAAKAEALASEAKRYAKELSYVFLTLDGDYRGARFDGLGEEIIAEAMAKADAAMVACEGARAFHAAMVAKAEAAKAYAEALAGAEAEECQC